MKIQALIVDDEPQSIQVLKQNVQWRRLGIENIYGAYSAQEAREIMARETIQIILCDIEMPGENGLEFIQWLREESNLNGKLVECIILTCYPDYSYMRKAMQIGCSDYLIKPVESAEVETVVAKAVEKVQMLEQFYSGTAFSRPENENDLIEGKVIPYIKEHYTEMLTVADIASYAGLNPQYMMRLFKKRIGSSVLEYVTALRLEAAKELLRTTDWTNEFVSEKIGYASSNYFIKLFKTQFGITPREFRKNNA